MRVSFDFDNTLTNPKIMIIAKFFVEGGHDVWITTTRRHIDSSEVFSVAEELGIPERKCVFTEMEDKHGYLIGFDLHFDDDEYEIDLITRNTKGCLGVLHGYYNYSKR